MRNVYIKSIAFFLAVLFFSLCASETVYASSSENNNTTYSNVSDDADTLIVVSLGDSYSSGEGIPPFYGQKDNGKQRSFYQKANDERWLAHRSTKSWPGLLKFPCMESGKTLKDYNVDSSNSTIVKWYFKASSGAETKHINGRGDPGDWNLFHTKMTRKPGEQNKTAIASQYHIVSKNLPKQIDVFDGLYGKVDYVTISIGGNDVGFTDVITTCVTKSTYIQSWNLFRKRSTLEKKLAKIWENFGTTRENIKNVYKDIKTAAGAQAQIIVAGYPKLLDQSGKGLTFSQKEAQLVNSNVSDFNKKLAEIVGECQDEGIKIEFVSVEEEFDKDGGHQAYSSVPWINPVIPGVENEDLNHFDITSAYSMHPTEEGAKAYATCVNKKIAVIETNGVLSGKVCKASNRSIPIANANVNALIKTHGIYSSILSTKTDSNGNYSMRAPEGEYLVKITANGYIDFCSYATVAKNETTYMETFLMVQGSESDKGIAKGRVVNSLAGTGVEGVNLSFRKYWNNTDASAAVVGTATTDADGYYTAELPLGNYTAVATKNGFLESTFNIIVQEGTTDNQNGTITPIVSGDDYLITLTWGENPNDLDSHVVGTLSSGDQFHVYYAYQSQYDGDIEVCNLDYDDTTSYGPEHITLKPTSDKPYYYYIHHYAGSGSISTSNAKIKVEKGGVLIRQFNVPTALGTDIYWNVFAIVNGEIVVKNTITPEPDIVYANNRNVSLRTLLASPNDITATEPKDDTEKDETVSDSKDTTSSTESSTPVVTESKASSQTESTVSSNEETVSSEVATVSSDETAPATEDAQTEDTPVSSSEDTASASPKVQNQAAAVPAQKEEADDVSPSDANN